MSTKTMEKGMVVATILFIIVAVWRTIYYTTEKGRIRQTCFQYGYSSALIFIDDESYCVKIENGTEVVVPLSELEKDTLND